ncbi:MAG: ATPase, T2SS/T4P/T4SS family, partial [Planctomycetota bacterium]
MKRLGDILIAQGVLDEESMENAFDSKPRGVMLGDWLVTQRLVSTAELGHALADQFEVPYVDIDPSGVDLQVARLLPENFARRHQSAAIGIAGQDLKLAMVAPDDIETISEVELMTGYRADPMVALAEDVEALISSVYDDRSFARQTIVDLKLKELAEAAGREDEDEAILAIEQEDAPVVQLVEAILGGAINAGASDIHLEPHRPEMRVRYRVDGELQQVMTIPNHIEDSVISRIKVMADMDTTENRRPQDGQLYVHESGRRVGF